MVTMLDLRPHLKEFAQAISSQQLGVVRYSPEKWATSLKCIENASLKVEQNDGRVQFGWIFNYRVITKTSNLGYLIAIHHAIWHAPNGHLIDVTPFHSDPKHHPIAINDGSVVFLIDDNAAPIVTQHTISPLPSKFHPLGDNEELIEYVQQLRKIEEMEALPSLS